MQLKLKTVLLGLAVLCSSIMIFYGCQKTDSVLTSEENFKAAVDKWRGQENAIVSTNSKDLKKRSIDIIISHLDYSVARTVQTSDGSRLYLIRLNNYSVNQKFLSLEQKGGESIFNGIYEAGDIDRIVQFYSTKRLKKQDFIFVSDLDGNPLRGWAADKNGIQRQSVGTWKSRMEGARTTNSAGSTDKKVKVNLALAPPTGGEVCIDWYWTWYDPETGFLLYEEYIGSTGDCNDGFHNGGGGSAPQNPVDHSATKSLPNVFDIVPGNDTLYVSAWVDFVGRFGIFASAVCYSKAVGLDKRYYSYTETGKIAEYVNTGVSTVTVGYTGTVNKGSGGNTESFNIGRSQKFTYFDAFGPR
jgi:hypothetical protein